MTDIIKVRDLVAKLNRHNHLYFNESTPEITDNEYDKLFNELVTLEAETGLVLSNSPTQTVGAAIVSSLPTVQHDSPLLSLDKTKDIGEVVGFIGNRTVLIMLKLDGLTTKLEYRGGELFRASTRGDGHEGEEITHNVRTFLDVPLKIPYKGDLIVVGETYMLDEDFKHIQSTTVGSDGKPYKNSRNLAAGSARLLDAGECAKRRIRFSAFAVQDGGFLRDGYGNRDSVIAGININTDASIDTAISIPVNIDTNSKDSILRYLQKLGFKVAYYHKTEANDESWLDVSSDVKNNSFKHVVSHLKFYASKMGIPIDGLVIAYDDIAYSQSLGYTGRYYRDGIAFKFEDDTTETVLRRIEWNVSRSGELSPVAVFDPVEIDGTEVERASLHNIKFIRELDLKIGDRIAVSKRNMIIPHVEANLDADAPRHLGAEPNTEPSEKIATGAVCTTINASRSSILPTQCPCCSSALATIHNNEGEPSLFCQNTKCFDRRLKGFEHFVEKKALNITGLSAATLNRFMEAGLLNEKVDIFGLYNHEGTIINMKGFGKKAFDRLIGAIEDSRTTTMERFIISMDIPMVGRHASAILCEAFDYDLDAIKSAAISEIHSIGHFDFTTLNDFGDTLHNNIRDWFASEDNIRQWEQVSTLLTFKPPKRRQSLPIRPVENLSNPNASIKSTIGAATKVTDASNLQNINLFDDGLFDDKPFNNGTHEYDLFDVSPMGGNTADVSLVYGVLTDGTSADGMDDSNGTKADSAFLGNLPPNNSSAGNKMSYDALPENPFLGKAIVATGSFINFTRDTINEQIEDLGAKAGSSVSKNTDYVIAGDKAGSKKAKAHSLGIPVLSESEFMEMAGI